MKNILKYPRRKKRTIGGTEYLINAPTESRSHIMKSVKSEKTSIEMALAKELDRLNINYSSPENVIAILPGKPDFVLPQYHAVIFCDGDFWHGYNFTAGNISNNASFWNAKIQNNIQRDIAINEEYKKIGWTVFRFWEHDIEKNLEKCICDLMKYLTECSHKRKQGKFFSFVDLFAGIGGFRIPLEVLGGECKGFSEIDSAAISSYKKNFIDFSNETETCLGSVTEINKFDFPVDLVTGGVPCQSWSVAGKKRGFDDPRGKLWFDSIRIVQKNNPKAFIFENVKGLYDPRNKANLNLILDEFDKIGYKVYYQLMNSFDYGLPQNRERIYLVGIRKDLLPRLKENYRFPSPINENPCLFDFIEGVEKKIIAKKKIAERDLFGNKIPLARNRCQRLDELNDFFTFCDTRNGHSTIHSWEIHRTTQREREICLAILRNRRKRDFGDKDGNPIPFEKLQTIVQGGVKQEEIDSLVAKKILRYVPNLGFEFSNSKNSAGIDGVYRIYLPSATLFSTLTATGTKDCVALRSIEAGSPEEYKELFLREIYSKKAFKWISSRDAGRLQGFPPEFIYHSNAKLAMKQFGNAVSVPVVYNVALQLVKTGIFDL